MKRSFCKLLILSNFLVFMTGHALFSSNIDSLKALTEAASPEKKVKLFIQLSEEYSSDSLSLSMEYAREALNIAEQINDRKAESDALCQIGNVYYYLYKPEKALEIFSECLDIKQKINDEKGLSKVLNYIGVVYYDMPNYDSAKKYFTHSYDIAKESKNIEQEAYALYRLGNISRKENDLEKAHEYFNNALLFYEKMNDLNGIAQVHNSIGLIYYSEEKYDSAVVHYQKTKSIREKSGDIRGAGIALHNIANVYIYWGRYEDALPYYFKALRSFEIIDFKLGISSCQNNIALIYEEWSKLEKAREYYKKALKTRQEIGNEKEIANTLSNLGNLCTQEVIDTLEIEYGEKWIDSVNIYENTREMMKKFAEALRYHKQALEIRQEIDDKRGIASSLNNMGTVYMNAGNNPKALEYYQKALDLSEELESTKESIINLLGMARAYQYINNLEKALSYLNRSYEVAKSINAKPKLRDITESFAEIYALKNNYQKAYHFYREYSKYKDDILNNQFSEKLAEEQTKYETVKKEARIKLLNKENALAEQRNKTMRRTIIFFIVGFVLVGGLTVVVIRQNNKVKQANSLLETKNELITQQHNEIKDSINYARQIQKAILPPDDYIDKLYSDRFIFYKPRDVVSGDFYWISRQNNRIITVAADCTGHGVPGAFMSMLGIAFFNEIVSKNPNIHANEILNEMRSRVIDSLHQTGKTGGSQDGMDLALHILDYDTNTLEFSGANNPLVLIRDGELSMIKGDKMPIGIYELANQKFTNHTIEFKKDDRLYTFSDGYQDQFGGTDGKKFKIKNLKNLLLEIHLKPMNEQKEILDKTFKDWMAQSGQEQIDDVILIGIKI